MQRVGMPPRRSAPRHAAAGDLLGRLGDPRFRRDAWHLPAEPLLGFVAIPGGSFRMGSDKREDAAAETNELPQHMLSLPPYYMARYPVTVAQFRAWLEASGTRPRHPEALSDAPTRPVRYVEWYEAVAYAAWLTTTLREWLATPEPLATLLRRGDGRSGPWTITLPSEAEWERAARGKEGRIYPWGRTCDPEKANYDASGIGTTSAVGCFPAGASLDGIEEMGGNVWEWTRSVYRPYPYDPHDGREDLSAGRGERRVLRGGAYYYLAANVRCGVRNRNSPNGRNRHLGFRVVASPSLLDSDRLISGL
jgi:formylglycine-generating enzyme required for sulfatase activity